MEQPAPQLLAVRVMDGLFVGNAIAAQDEEFLVSNKVTHIVNCAGLEVANIFQEKVEYLTFPFRDVLTTVILDNQDRHIAKVVQFIDKTFEKGECVLVHSLHGVSRSCTMIGAYLIYKYGWSLDSSLSFLHVAHADMQIQVYFVRQLKALAKRKFKDKDIFTIDANAPSPPLRDQQELLKNTYVNSLPYDEKNFPPGPPKKRHNKKLSFSEDLILKQRTNNLIDPTTNQRRVLQGILKRPEGYKPPEKIVVPQTNAPTNGTVKLAQEKPPLKKQSSSDDEAPQLNIITGPEANQQAVTVDQLFQSSNTRISSPPQENSPQPLVEDKRRMTPKPQPTGITSPTNGGSVKLTNLSASQPTITMMSSQNGALNPLSMSQDMNGVRKRPTAFSTSSMRPVSAPSTTRPHANPPTKYRKPTPPKRSAPQNAPPPSNGAKQGDPSFVIYSRKSMSNTNSPQPNNAPQQPLFYRVNRPPSPNVVENENTGGGLRNSQVMSSSLKQSVSKPSSPQTSQNNMGEKRRPASAPKNRTTNSNTLTASMFMSGPQNTNADLGSFRKSGSTTAISSLKSIYGEEFPNGDVNDDDSSSSDMFEDDRKGGTKKKKKVTKQKRGASPSESRLMKPTLSFLRKTVKKGP